ncbi:hypothetical protein F7734_09865 [Scytonema sp. UIC 10036]|uniref:hypothetical protein n=1 Tax=Scytonema sp. UIC 10036 TaxID=2304196 RepID=UPI0012DA18DB|nr:hypothetical protein [Scytonema sp. UIC 10036]MUG92737.1 hypothetical protein [Scytonema sp. UIC 10036]
MKLLRILSLISTIAATASITAPAMAIPFGSNTVYKGVDGLYQVVVFSGTPGSKITVSLGSVPKTTAKIVGSCGEVRISPPASGAFTGLKVDGTAVDASTLPSNTLPACSNGAFAEPRTANFKTPNNEVVIVGKTAGTAISIELPQPSAKTVTVNACGFGQIKATATTPLPSTFSVGTTNYTVSSLPDASKPPLCRTANGISTGYVPSTWP